jgi:preprotein translocase subunit SecD
MKEVQDIIQRRAEAFGAKVSNLRREGTNRLAFEVSGVTAGQARELFGRTALLDFREPEQDETNHIVCQDPTGQRFTVPPNPIPASGGGRLYVVADADGNLTLCQTPGEAASQGNVVWRPPKGIGSDGIEKTLTGRYLLANAKVVSGPPGQPLVQLEFDPEGAFLFDQISSRLVGQPMAIFLDGELISAPTVMARISKGDFVIDGLTADEGRMLAIQVNSGPLPVPVRLISEGEGLPP